MAQAGAWILGVPSTEDRRAPEASSRGEHGITALALLVGADGAPRRVELLGSSGSAALDSAARESLARCRFKPAVVDGKFVERWQVMQYVWQPADKDPMSMLTCLLDVAAAQGRPAAQYARYSMLGQQAARAGPGPRAPPAAQLTVLLRHAAAGGHCLSKYVLAQLHEHGGAVKQDLRQAREWYEQAAAGGNPAAADRLGHMPASR